MRPRISIGGLMAAILLVALATSALRSASPLWASTIFTMTLGVLATAVLGACFAGRRRRPFSVGFALLGWGYMTLAFGPWFDQAASALLTDLHRRGLLASTLVVAHGEFGRSPKVNDKAGREHWPGCYSALLAGGGVRGGRVVGESDRRAERPHDRPVTPADLAATIHHCVGITSEQAASAGILW